jgi:hypothetical protein
VQQPSNTYTPWTMQQDVWCTQTGHDANTYERLVTIAYQTGDFDLADPKISRDAHWTIRRYRSFGQRRVQ